MDELAAARAKLTLLGAKEKQLLKSLFDVRAAVDAQLEKIDALVRRRHRTIVCLPTELLVWIFGLCIDSHSRGEGILQQRQQLASVSRHWRDAILHNPTLWKYISVTPHDAPSLKTRLKRSQGVSLDIVITGWRHMLHEQELTASLRLIISCANRWHSLTLEENFETSTALVISELNHAKFPSLHHVDLKGFGVTPSGDVPSPVFLSPINSPALEHFVIRDLVAPASFPALSNLKTLDMSMFGDDFTTHLSFPALPLFSHSLTELSLCGRMDSWSLGLEGGINLPALRMLSLWISEPRQLMEAIVAPMLEDFDYSSEFVEDFDSVVFARVGNRFCGVRHLSFDLASQQRHPDDACGIALCRAFPNARCVDINADDVYLLFEHSQEPGSQGCPLNAFKNLELLTICGSGSNWASPWRELRGLDSLEEWLTDQMESGQKLRVKLKGNNTFVLEGAFNTIYNQLQNCCILEVDGISVATAIDLFTSETSSSLRAVSIASCNFSVS